MNKYTVYKHTSPCGKTYIGVTGQSVTRRWNNGSGYKKCPLFYNAIKKYGWDNFNHEILFEGLTKEEAEQKEIELISFYKSNDREFGYNIENGGNCKGTHSEEVKLKISTGNKGKTIDMSTPKQISRINKLKTSMLGENNPFYGKKHSTESKQKISKSRIGNKWSVHKKIKQFDLFGNYINSYESIAEANRITGVSIAGICQCCKGIYTKSGGYVWRYANEQ